jgi:hypothetical protein
MDESPKSHATRAKLSEREGEKQYKKVSATDAKEVGVGNPAGRNVLSPTRSILPLGAAQGNTNVAISLPFFARCFHSIGPASALSEV